MSFYIMDLSADLARGGGCSTINPPWILMTITILKFCQILSGLIRGGKGGLRSQDILVVLALPDSSLSWLALPWVCQNFE